MHSNPGCGNIDVQHSGYFIRRQLKVLRQNHQFAPVFGQIASFALPYLRIPPQ